ncbi:MAG: ParA family protein [Saprospiraceae bacterium]|nr:ParA family protein [Saprospiraceae bacterium]
MAKVFTIENRKGGVSKTTTSVTLAVGLAERLRAQDGRVLIVDVDPQGHAARALGLKPSGECISNVLTGQGTLKDNILSADRSKEGGPARPNLFVLPASDRLKEAKEELVATWAAQSVVRRLGGRNKKQEADDDSLIMLLEDKLGPAKKVFDYILIDCPPTLDMLQQAVHYFADYAIVPVRMDFLGVSATGQHTENILEDQAAGIDIKIFAVIPTFVEARLNLTRAMMAQLVEKYGRLVVKGIPSTVKIAEAVAADGLTILEYAPESLASVAYQELVDRMISQR